MHTNDKKVVGVFVLRFRAPLQPSFAPKQLLFLTIGFTFIGGSTVTV
jgi:hypothetical protein